MQVVRAGLTFDVRDEGPRDGEPVVLLHGFPQTSVIWAPDCARRATARGEVAPVLLRHRAAHPARDG